MKATIVDLTQPLKPAPLAWENPLISVKLVTMCLFSSLICMRMTSHTNHTTTRTVYNNWTQQHYQGYTPSTVNIWMFIHYFAILLASYNPLFGLGPIFERLTWDVFLRVVLPELVHNVGVPGRVLAVHFALLQGEGGVRLVEVLELIRAVHAHLATQAKVASRWRMLHLQQNSLGMTHDLTNALTNWN